MFDDMIRLLDEMSFSRSRTDKGGCWYPHVDVYRTRNGWLVKFELAGVSPKELRLERSGRRLTIRGRRRDAIVQQGMQSYSLEISYNRFERTLEMPVDIQSCDLTTDYRDGMLLVWLDQKGKAKT